ncbi:peptidoglycan-binding domain-containing protein [Tepidamorphus sp. 3E244]|uniref:peptidoglycan-binding domain-containing protein n=1 Tax=Tepidamorphus sp. 3E244 TaxID=3385498 RepID=UPI0038FC511D
MTSMTGMETDTMTLRARDEWDEMDDEPRGPRGFLPAVPLRRHARRIAMFGAVAVWGVVGYNALVLQPGPHPAPFFSVNRTLSSGQQAPEQAQRLQPADPAGPVVRRQAAPTAPQAEPITFDQPMILRIQHALLQRGYDVGEPDGLMGPRTRAAISAFESGVGLTPTGEPSAALVERLDVDRAAPAPEPVQTRSQAAPQPAAQPAPQATSQGGSEMERALSMAEREPDTGTRVVRTQAVRIDDLIAGAPPGGSDPSLVPVPAAPVGDPVIAQVQNVLASIGYAPGKIDGFAGADTQNAIARFRADRGLPAGTSVTQDLLNELTRVSGVAIQY